ncbi:hypothetical protein MTO96_017766 [Rhipicephalus appendiculatus]
MCVAEGANGKSSLRAPQQGWLLPGPRKGRHPEMETALADFVQTQRAAALPVTTEVLQVKARKLSRERGVSAADFKASRGLAAEIHEALRLQPPSSHLNRPKVTG